MLKPLTFNSCCGTPEVKEPPNNVSVCMPDVKHDVLESWRKPSVKIKQGKVDVATRET